MAIKLNKGCELGKYFYQKDTVTYGPIPIDELIKRIDGETLVYFEGSPWKKAKLINELAPYFQTRGKRKDEEKNKSNTQHALKEVYSSNDASIPPPIETSKVKTLYPDNSPKNSQAPKIVTALTILLIVSGALFYFLWYQPYLKDKNAMRMYSFASSLALRSSSVAGVDYNVIGNILYGSELLVYANNGEWVQCKANQTEGFASSKYLLDKKDFHLLNGIFADADSKEAAPTTKCKKALLGYFKDKNFIGKMDESVQIEVFDSVLHREIWQLIARKKESKPNTVFFPRVVNPNSKFTDFACLITNIETRKRKFLLFSFNEMEEPKLEYESDAPDTGYILDIQKTDNLGTVDYWVKYSN